MSGEPDDQEDEDNVVNSTRSVGGDLTRSAEPVQPNDDQRDVPAGADVGSPTDRPQLPASSPIRDDVNSPGKVR